jgi:hypothetical protein
MNSTKPETLMDRRSQPAMPAERLSTGKSGVHALQANIHAPSRPGGH